MLASVYEQLDPLLRHLTSAKWKAKAIAATLELLSVAVQLKSFLRPGKEHSTCRASSVYGFLFSPGSELWEWSSSYLN